METTARTEKAPQAQKEIALGPSVEFGDGRVLIANLEVVDEEVVQFLVAKDDPPAAIVDLLRLAVRVMHLAESRLDVEFVKSEFEKMTGSMGKNVDTLLEGAKAELKDRLKTFHDDELKKSLDEHKGSLSSELVRLFGPESAASIQNQIDKLLEEQADNYKKGLAAIIEPTDDPGNPFNKLRRGVSDEVKKTLDEVKGLRDEVMKIVGGAAEREKGTAKGRSYQEYVFEQAERIARVYGDTAEYVADRAGQKGKSKAGDVVVEINPAQTGNTRVALVFEAKNTPNLSVKSILDDLEEAKENRVAVAAVAVFSHVEYVPAGLSSWRDYPGHRYVCVLREDEPDPYQLEYSYRMARVDALESIEPAEARLDVPAIRSLLKQVRARLGELQQMRTKLTGAKGAIEDVHGLIEKHQEAMRSDFDEIDCLLSVREKEEVAQ